MTSSSLSGFATGVDPARYWSLIFSGKVLPLNWDDGERLLALSAAVRAGEAPPQEFRCIPRGAGRSEQPVLILVTDDTSFELITEYDHSSRSAPSYWFG